jgi:carboxypeptidase C (cathepsin A)
LITSLALLVAAALVQPLPPVSARTERLPLGTSLARAQAPPGRPVAEAPPQAPPPAGQPGQPAQAAKPPETTPEPRKPEGPPVVTRREVRVGGRVLKYTVTTGTMPIRNDRGEDEADIFYMAYTLDRPAATPAAARPLMFSFNGGPGSSSVWLHLGALGPRRVRMLPDGGLPPPPYELVDNEHTWLDLTDLVFVDPVGTGYSRAEKPELGRKFWGVRGDIESVGEFIRLYLTRNERWASPLFVVGESYGTTRAAGLAGHLIDRGVAFNGVLLVSSILQFQTARFARGNDLPPVLFLPTYTATAWYHKKLAPDLQKDLKKTLDEVERWASTEYTLALAKGSALQGAERQKAIEQLARYTGLSKNYLEHTDLRIEIQRFCKELLREDGRTVGRLDSRFKGFDSLGVSERPDFDPSMAAIRPPYTAMFNHYVRNELGYKSDVPYHILGGGINAPWDWGTEGQGYADLSESLRSAFAKNPFMKVFVASGYYDLATPYYATEYTLSHMGLDPSLRDNIRVAEYEAGHMMYIHEPSLAKLKADVASFIGFALDKNGAAIRSTSGGE